MTFHRFTFAIANISDGENGTGVALNNHSPVRRNGKKKMNCNGYATWFANNTAAGFNRNNQIARRQSTVDIPNTGM